MIGMLLNVVHGWRVLLIKAGEEEYFLQHHALARRTEKKIKIRHVRCLVQEIKKEAKKVVSDSEGLLDFGIGLMNSVLNLPYRKVKFFQEFKNFRRAVTNANHFFFHAS